MICWRDSAGVSGSKIASDFRMRFVVGVLALTLSGLPARADDARSSEPGRSSQPAPPVEPARPANLASPSEPVRSPGLSHAKVPLRVVRVMPDSGQALLYDRSRS